jgi:hypothetical protein
MLQVTPQIKILVALDPVDFRRGIDGLARRLQVMAKSGDLSGAFIAAAELGRAFDRFRFAALARGVGGA